jgi:hypothetical protein
MTDDEAIEAARAITGVHDLAELVLYIEQLAADRAQRQADRSPTRSKAVH